ncbi:MAG: nucleotidyltransferase domain-containing protein [Candidatus Thorarchaeota archaeon]
MSSLFLYLDELRFLRNRLLMIDPSHIKVLKFIIDHLESKNITWAITGSLSMALQGVPVIPNDIDIQTDEIGAYEIEKLFKDYVTRPITFYGDPSIKSHFGSITIFGIQVEIMGGVQKLLPNGTWEPPIDIQPHRQLIKLKGMDIPVLSLKYEESAYRKLGRIKRADFLKRYLENEES